MEEIITSQDSIQNNDHFYATGKRKTSIAKVWLKKGTGNIYVNGKKYEDYFKRANHKMQILRPFEKKDSDLILWFNIVGVWATTKKGSPNVSTFMN